jgi:hypothetical protein
MFSLSSLKRMLEFNNISRYAPEGKQAVKLTRLSCHRFRANMGIPV